MPHYSTFQDILLLYPIHNWCGQQIFFGSSVKYKVLELTRRFYYLSEEHEPNERPFPNVPNPFINLFNCLKSIGFFHCLTIFEGRLYIFKVVLLFDDSSYDWGITHKKLIGYVLKLIKWFSRKGRRSLFSDGEFDCCFYSVAWQEMLSQHPVTLRDGMNLPPVTQPPPPSTLLCMIRQQVVRQQLK